MQTISFRNVIAAGAAAAALSGCASIDHFSGSMATFNKQAEHTQDEAIMLNVLRAADYRPLSFTELQTVSQTVTPSAMLSLTAPLAQNGSMTPTTITPTVGFTGGPTISASYIDTQDFYRGMLTPLPMSTIDLLIQRRIPSMVLADLLFSRIIVSQVPNSQVDKGDIAKAETFTSINDPTSFETRLPAYQDLVEALLNEGLTTAPGDPDKKDVGPPFTDREMSFNDRISKAAAASLKVEDVDPCDLTDLDAWSLYRRTGVDYPALKTTIKTSCAVIDHADKNPDDPKAPVDKANKAVLAALAKANAPLIYRFVKAADKADPQFCMAAPRSPDGVNKVPPPGCLEGSVFNGTPDSGTKLKVRITVRANNEDNESRLCQALNENAKSGAPLDCSNGDWLANGLDVELEPRSTYSIIYYLGELERRERRGEPPLLVKIGDVLTAVPAGRCTSPDQKLSPGAHSYDCQPLFYLARDAEEGRAFLTVDYDGHVYSVPDSFAEAGKTNEVLDIVNELTALNHSAKDSPASSLITVVGVH